MLYAYAMPNQRRTCSVWDFLQMLFRVRELEIGEMNIMLHYDNSDNTENFITEDPITISDLKKKDNNTSNTQNYEKMKHWTR